MILAKYFWKKLVLRYSHTASTKRSNTSLCWELSGQGFALTTHPHLASRWKKACSYSYTASVIPLPTPPFQRSLMASYGLKFTFTIIHAMVRAASAKPLSAAHRMLTGNTWYAYTILLEENFGEITWKTEENMKNYSSFHIYSLHWVML